MSEETGARQIITSEYNKLRTEEYLHLRGRFYKRFPKCLQSDYEFEQEIFLYFDILQAEIKQLIEENKKLKAENNRLEKEEPKLCICSEEITEENAHLHRNCGK